MAQCASSSELGQWKPKLDSACLLNKIRAAEVRM
jgi:hypothetical protein